MKGISVQEAATRLTEAGMRLGDRYNRGASGKGGKWFTAASGAEANYTAGIQDALSKKKFSSGVSKAGAGSYDAGVSTKGVMNWPTGMQLAGTKYTRKVQPFVTLWTAPLPTPRGARRSPNNIKRMQENVDRFTKAAA